MAAERLRLRRRPARRDDAVRTVRGAGGVRKAGEGRAGGGRVDGYRTGHGRRAPFAVPGAAHRRGPGRQGLPVARPAGGRGGPADAVRAPHAGPLTVPPARLDRRDVAGQEPRHRPGQRSRHGRLRRQRGVLGAPAAGPAQRRGHLHRHHPGRDAHRPGTGRPRRPAARRLRQRRPARVRRPGRGTGRRPGRRHRTDAADRPRVGQLRSAGSGRRRRRGRRLPPVRAAGPRAGHRAAGAQRGGRPGLRPLGQRRRPQAGPA